MDHICGKRLQPLLPELIRILERHNEFSCDGKTKAKLLRISAASIDRLLRPERRKCELRGRAGTKPGTLLKPTTIKPENSIPAGEAAESRTSRL